MTSVSNTEKLKLSIALELINSFIETQYSRFYVDSKALYKDELETLLLAIQFWEAQTGKKKGYAASIQHQLEK